MILKISPRRIRLAPVPFIHGRGLLYRDFSWEGFAFPELPYPPGMSLSLIEGIPNSTPVVVASSQWTDDDGHFHDYKEYDNGNWTHDIWTDSGKTSQISHEQGTAQSPLVNDFLNKTKIPPAPTPPPISDYFPEPIDPEEQPLTVEYNELEAAWEAQKRLQSRFVYTAPPQSLEAQQARQEGTASATARARNALAAAEAATRRPATTASTLNRLWNGIKWTGSSITGLETDIWLSPWQNTSKPIFIDKLKKDLEYAQLAQAAYKGQTLDPVMAAKWEIPPEDGEFRDPLTGLDAVVFRNKETGEIVLAFAGTTFENLNDVKSNGRQGLFGEDRQYEQAVETFLKVRSKFGFVDHVVGHSLGGGLASTVSAIFGVRGTTFNAAGVHRQIVGAYGKKLDRLETLVEAYRVKGEILSTLQDSWLTPGLLMPNGNGNYRWLPATSRDPIERHLMDDVIKRLIKKMENQQ